MVLLLLHFDIQDGIKWHLLIERRANFCRSFANIIPVYYVCFQCNPQLKLARSNLIRKILPREHRSFFLHLSHHNVSHTF